MTREQAESRIHDLLVEIREVHKQYNPDADFLIVVMHGDHYMEFNNSYWCEDANYPIKYREDENCGK